MLQATARTRKNKNEKNSYSQQSIASKWHLKRSLLVKVVPLLLEQLRPAQARPPRSLGGFEPGLGAGEHRLEIAVAGVQAHSCVHGLHGCAVVPRLQLALSLGDQLDDLRERKNINGGGKRFTVKVEA